MRLSLLTLLLSACLPLGAWSADAARYPLRQIDRPLILPKGMWQERLTWSQAFSPEEDDPGRETVRGFLPNLPSWSITDNLSWAAVPFPLFRYLLTRNNIQPDVRPAVTDFSLTLDGGLLGLAYSSRDGFRMYSVLGLSFKKPWSRRLWSEGSVAAAFSNADPFTLIASTGLGIQWSERIHSVTTYTATQLFRSSGYRLYQGATQSAGINFHPGLSLDLSLGVIAGRGEVWLNPGASIAFQW
jgi:hypothetical protein